MNTINKTADLIQLLERTASSNEKDAILTTAWQNGERIFFQAARLALDSTVTFGIKKVTVFDENNDDGNDLSFDDFLKFAHRLRLRELTGNRAIEVMRQAADRSSSRVWNTLYRRILLKDFKIGMKVSSINKVLSKIGTIEALSYVVPVFQCQLAQSSDDHPKKLTGEQYLDVKLDGVRLLTVVDIEAQTVRQYTRNGHEVVNYPILVEQFSRLLPHLPFSTVFDGEVTARTFQELMGQIRRKSNVDTDAHKLQLFDIVPWADFQRGISKISQKQRHETLTGLIPLMQQEGMDNVTVLPKILVDLSTQEGRDAMEKFKQEVLEAASGETETKLVEGFMIKNPNGPYECRKATNWLKWKPFITVDLEVVGMERGKPDGKYHDTLGALVCRGNHEGKYVETNVATGLSDELRKFFWENPDEIVGFIIEVDTDGLTQNENMVGTNTYSLRFPAFNRKRGTEAGEKI